MTGTSQAFVVQEVNIMGGESRVRVGTGVFGWDGAERRSNRYGSFQLNDQTYGGALPTAKLEVDVMAIARLLGHRVRVTCKVIEARKSGHIGDLFLQVFPATPTVGEEVDLGAFHLFSSKEMDDGPNFILQPTQNDRDELWIDPRKLYRLHDQTVEVFMEETNDESDPVAELSSPDEVAVLTDEPGITQVKTKETGPLRIPPKVEKLGDGLFMMSPIGAAQPGDVFPVEPATRTERKSRS